MARREDNRRKREEEENEFTDRLVHINRVAKTVKGCLLYTSPSPRDGLLSRMPSSA